MTKPWFAGSKIDWHSIKKVRGRGNLAADETLTFQLHAVRRHNTQALTGARAEIPPRAKTIPACARAFHWPKPTRKAP